MSDYLSWFVPSAPSRIEDPLSPELEEEFEVLFGEEPGVRPGPNPERAKWQRARDGFEGITEPSAPSEFVEAALEDYDFFEVGRPVFYSDKGRVLARFQGAPLDWNPDEYTVVYAPDQVISVIQVKQIKRGIKQDKVNPLVPYKYVRLNSELE